jgi:hypothetical protein
MIPHNPAYELKRQFALMAEKALSTFVQVFLTVLLASSAIGADAAQVALLAAIAAGGSALVGAIPVVPDGLPFSTDLFLRVVRTFCITSGTLFFAGNNGYFELSIGAAEAATLAAIPAVLAVAKGAIAKRFGAPESAALLSSRVDPASFALAS